MFVTQLGHYPIVLGIQWLELHDVAIRFSYRTLTFGSQYCASHCNQRLTVVHADSLTPKVAHEEPAVSAGAGEFGAQSFTSPKCPFQNQVDNHKDFLMVTASNLLNVENYLPNTRSTFPTTRNMLPKAASNLLNAESTFVGNSSIRISAIGGQAFRQTAYMQKLTIFSTSLYEINQVLGVDKQAKKPKELDLKDYVPAEYHEFLPLFSETLAKNLPPHLPYDHKIPLREGFTPPFGPLY